jgi:hypothetical protein
MSLARQRHTLLEGDIGHLGRLPCLCPGPVALPGPVDLVLRRWSLCEDVRIFFSFLCIKRGFNRQQFLL